VGKETTSEGVSHCLQARKTKSKVRREEAAQIECYDLTAHGKFYFELPIFHYSLANSSIPATQTRNSDKYNKNAGRNRLRAIEIERRTIWANAVKMAQRLAAVHDPSGEKFNVGPVTTLEDGSVISLEALERRKERQRERELKEQAVANGEVLPMSNGVPNGQPNSTALVNGMNPQRQQLVQSSAQQPGPRQISKTHQRKLEALAPRPPPPKPTIPEGVSIPSDEEEDWISLWDLPDGELERRVVRAKKRAAAARKALRVKQKEGKAERRAARDEKRKVYRNLKEAWKVVRGTLVPPLHILICVLTLSRGRTSAKESLPVDRE
jgi:hypothetical protein